MEETNNHTYREITKDIEQFLSIIDSTSFTNKEVDDQFQYRSRDAKRYRWQILEAYVKKDELKRLKTGVYRKPDDTLEEMDILGAKEGDAIPLKMPLGLHDYIRVYRGSTMVIAGSPGAGKTAWMYEFILLNSPHKNGVILWTNDMTDVETKERLMNYPGWNPLPDPLPFKAYERADNFGDVIAKFPDAIHVIDYLDLNSETYLIGAELELIHRALGKGIAVVGIQKRPNQDIGIGGLFSWKRPKYYFAIDVEESVTGLTRKLKVVKVRGKVKSNENVHGKIFRYDLAGGIRCQLREGG